MERPVADWLRRTTITPPRDLGFVGQRSCRAGASGVTGSPLIGRTVRTVQVACSATATTVAVRQNLVAQPDVKLPRRFGMQPVTTRPSDVAADQLPFTCDVLYVSGQPQSPESRRRTGRSPSAGGSGRDGGGADVDVGTLHVQVHDNGNIASSSRSKRLNRRMPRCPLGAVHPTSIMPRRHPSNHHMRNSHMALSFGDSGDGGPSGAR